MIILPRRARTKGGFLSQNEPLKQITRPDSSTAIDFYLSFESSKDRQTEEFPKQS